jgi:hypothetical protein
VRREKSDSHTLLQFSPLLIVLEATSIILIYVQSHASVLVAVGLGILHEVGELDFLGRDRGLRHAWIRPLATDIGSHLGKVLSVLAAEEFVRRN